eukprot:SAG31_NODE_37511_length_303_cov_1.544118_1_plen_31_part_10
MVQLYYPTSIARLEAAASEDKCHACGPTTIG